MLHVIVGLGVGGAELMLKRLIEAHRADSSIQHTVISLTSLGVVGKQLQAAGVVVEAMGMRSPRHAPVALWRLARRLRQLRPAVVQTWMYHADLIGGLAARIAGVRCVIWGIRNTLIPQGQRSRSQLVISLCAKLSRWIPNKIVCCAEAARSRHVALGYAVEKMVVISNGFDLSALNPTLELKQSMRRRLGFSGDDVVIGIVGRFDPLKDHENFLSAATRVAALRPQARFMMVGRDIDTSNAQLRGWLSSTGFSDRFSLLGERNDVANCMAAMDIFCLSSRAEGFPNVVAEAMGMHVPCVVTNVGDAALVVRDTGYVVPPQDAISLADSLIAMVDLSCMERKVLGVRAREVVENDYSINSIAKQYADLYKSLT